MGQLIHDLTGHAWYEWPLMAVASLFKAVIHSALLVTQLILVCLWILIVFLLAGRLPLALRRYF